MSMMNIRAKILEDAENCVNGAREQSYGSPEDNFKTIADFWNAYLGNDGITSTLITPMDVSVMMVLMKVARISSGKATYDSFVDIAGYAACGGEISENNKAAKAAINSMYGHGGFTDAYDPLTFFKLKNNIWPDSKKEGKSDGSDVSCAFPGEGN